MKSNRHNSAVMVYGFDPYTSPPEQLIGCEDLKRLAVVFKPNLGLNTEWKYYEECYLQFIHATQTVTKVSSVEILWENISFSSVAEYENRLSSLGDDEEHFPPERVVFRNNEEIVAVAETEFWVNCGGPQPYSDSYTIAFYTKDKGIEYPLKEKFFKILSSSGVPIVDELVVKPTFTQAQPSVATWWRLMPLWKKLICLLSIAVMVAILYAVGKNLWV